MDKDRKEIKYRGDIGISDNYIQNNFVYKDTDSIIYTNVGRSFGKVFSLEMYLKKYKNMRNSKNI